MPMPTCKYTIRKDEIDGPILHYARVGDQVVHRWECESEMYGLLVHSCWVEDGQGEKRMVIDERGCHIDRTVLGDPTYVEALNMAYRESYVFKFADRVGVRFQCEIKLCFKRDGGCNGITPPNCASEAGFQSDVHDDWVADVGNSTSSTPTSFSKKVRRSADNDSRTVTTDLISQYVYVLDTLDDVNEAERLESTEDSALLQQRRRTPICMSTTMFTTILLLVAAVFTGASLLVIQVYKRQSRSKLPPMTPRHPPTSFRMFT
ncbi:CRE-CUTL-11 protein [Aphelenchoides avenae]|nr:CRE-CUTL-11 protein [Aphelenchus avenae]